MENNAQMLNREEALVISTWILPAYCELELLWSSIFNPILIYFLRMYSYFIPYSLSSRYSVDGACENRSMCQRLIRMIPSRTSTTRINIESCLHPLSPGLYQPVMQDLGIYLLFYQKEFGNNVIVLDFQ